MLYLGSNIVQELGYDIAEIHIQSNGNMGFPLMQETSFDTLYVQYTLFKVHGLVVCGFSQCGIFIIVCV